MRYRYDPSRAPGDRFVEVDYARPVPGPRVYVQGVREPWESPLDGKVYSSVRRYEADLRAQGCRIKEPGEPLRTGQTDTFDTSAFRQAMIDASREMGHSVEGRFPKTPERQV